MTLRHSPCKPSGAGGSAWVASRYPQATRLVITADGGGSNGHCVRLWKLELSRFAREMGLDIRVCHFPPGTSKCNKIEHRLFSFITMNWRGRPLVSHEVIVNLIANTKTRSGSKVRAELDNADYPKDVDGALTGMGFAMGPFAVADLSGLDIAWRMRKAQAATRDPRERYVGILDSLCERGPPRPQGGCGLLRVCRRPPGAAGGRHGAADHRTGPSAKRPKWRFGR